MENGLDALCPAGDRQEIGLFLREFAEVLVHIGQVGGIFEFFLGDRLFLAFEQFPGCVAPRTEVVFVKHDQIPLHFMKPRVLGLNVAHVVAAQQVLEGTEIDQRLTGGDFCRVAVRIAGEVLPAVELRVGFEVSLPRIFYGGFKSDYEHPLGPEFPGELITGEGLAESHLGVPQETRDGVHILIPDGMKIGVSLFHSGALFGAHRECLGVCAGELQPGAQLGQDCFHILERAAHPFQFRVRAALSGKGGAHLIICEGRAVLALGDPLGVSSGMDSIVFSAQNGQIRSSEFNAEFFGGTSKCFIPRSQRKGFSPGQFEISRIVN